VSYPGRSATRPAGTEGVERLPDRIAEVSRGYSRRFAGKASEALQGRKVEQTDRPSRKASARRPERLKGSVSPVSSVHKAGGNVAARKSDVHGG
jgi:hypothetical protein